MSSTETPAASCADILSMLVASRGYMAATDVNSFLLSKEKEEQSPPKSQSECSKISSIIIAFTKGSDY